MSQPVSGDEIRYNLAILGGQRAYPTGQRISPGQITPVATEFLEIFATDIQDLGRRALSEGEKREVLQLSHDLSRTASRIYDITEFGHQAYEMNAVPFIGAPQSPRALAANFGPGRIKTGIERLEGSYAIRRVKGDGHCEFRAWSYGLAKHYEATGQKALVLEYLDGLKKIYPEAAQDLQTMIVILRDQQTAETTIATAGTSNALVAALRRLACAYLRAEKSDVFASMAIVDSLSVENYLTQMSNFERAKYGGQAENRALSMVLGMKCTVIDAAVQTAAQPIHRTVFEPNQPLIPAFGNVGITLLFRTNHYDVLS